MEKTCRGCEHLVSRPNPDPDDWFRDDDVKVICGLSWRVLIERSEHISREELKVPNWCKKINNNG